MNAASIDALREIALRPAIEEGTTVRFKVQFDGPAYIPSEITVGGIYTGRRPYTYVAVLLGGSWYSTAQMPSTLDDGSAVRPKMSQAVFANVLRSPQVSDIQVATAWEAL